ncbi:MAG: hypothetical protein WC548_02020 [Candidatus Pacearchaeota archaeon]
MKKVLIVPILALLILPGFVLAELDDKPTVVSGIIYNQDNTGVVSGATIYITCNSVTRSAISDSDGAYAVVFATSDNCDDGDNVIVTALKDDLSGTDNGRVHDFGLVVNVAVVDVFMTPEFGLVMGLLTLVGAVGIFFVVKRN